MSGEGGELGVVVELDLAEVGEGGEVGKGADGEEVVRRRDLLERGKGG